MIGPSVHTPAGTCPGCGATINAASGVTAWVPSPGDVSVCLHCAAVNLFGEDLSIRAPTPEEMASIKQGENWPEVQRVQRTIHQALGSRKARYQ